MRIATLVWLLLAACGGDKHATKPGQGNPMPSGISVGQTCAPEQCTQPAPAPQLCPDGSQPPPACVTNVADECHWQVAQCRQ